MTAVVYRGPVAPHEAATVVLRRGGAFRPAAPRPTAPPVRPMRAIDAVRAAVAAPLSPAPSGLGYPPPTAYPALPVPPRAALVPAGLGAPLSGIIPIPPPSSSGSAVVDRAIARGRWLLACEPETRRSRRR